MQTYESGAQYRCWLEIEIWRKEKGKETGIWGHRCVVVSKAKGQDEIIWGGSELGNPHCMSRDERQSRPPPGETENARHSTSLTLGSWGTDM